MCEHSGLLDMSLTSFVAALMFVDMYWRLHSRLSASDVVKKTQ